MFTWICPKCGTEVPPSYNDCPNCEAREKAAAAAPKPVPVAAPAPAPAPVPVVQAPAPIVQPVAPVTQPPLVGTAPTEVAMPAFSYGGGSVASSGPVLTAPPSGMPSWLIAALSILAVGALGYGVIQFMRGRDGVAADSAAATEAIRPAGDNPLAKYVEIVGYRIVESKQQVTFKFIVINHSAGEIAPFELNMQVHTKNQKPGEASLFTLKTPVSGLLPFEAKDMSIPVKTALRAYEMPDWQFLTATFDIAQQ